MTVRKDSGCFASSGLLHDLKLMHYFLLLKFHTSCLVRVYSNTAPCKPFQVWSCPAHGTACSRTCERIWEPWTNKSTAVPVTSDQVQKPKFREFWIMSWQGSAWACNFVANYCIMHVFVLHICIYTGILELLIRVFKSLPLLLADCILSSATHWHMQILWIIDEKGASKYHLSSEVYVTTRKQGFWRFFCYDAPQIQTWR